MDFAPHAAELLRSEHAHRRLGFADDEIRAWCVQAGLAHFEVQRFDAAARIGELPLTVCLWTAHRVAPGSPA